ncbi:hypothetical protein [Spirosoma sordidisoli]|uniref:Uncharacterized protein n=1 Tax=Spirosoma sordidisoli TaxID=2502893 RepID=A0A4V1RVJ0_9BACT|nr:hypothetical protein [Spirosoma sordidisoli]RYC66938.1 hypothetical protein EQG79_26535 [Spirosoma sordidisoli]
MHKTSLNPAVEQMLFLEKYFKKIKSYKCYSGPISELELGYLNMSQISNIFPTIQHLSSDYKVNQFYNSEAAVLLGRNDKPHKQWLEGIRSKVDNKMINDKKIMSTLISFQYNKNSPNIEQTGLLLIGNIEDIVQCLPSDSLPVELDYISRTFKEVKSTL